MTTTPGRQATSWWWRIRGTVLVATANFAVATALAGTAAVLGLVVEDLLPATGHRHMSTTRILWLGIAVAALFATIVWRGSVNRRTGTLFYVRLLNDAWTDWHTTALQIASRRRMSLRSVTRWADLPSRTHHETIDLVDLCAEIAAALEAVVNGDRDDTAYTIAPNLPWPAALAIGTALPIVDDLHLLELSGPPGNPATAAPGSPTTIAPEISFRLPQPTADTTTPPPPTAHPREGTRVGLLLVFTGRDLPPDTVFDGMGVGEVYTLDSASMGVTHRAGDRLTAAQLATLAASLPPAVAAIKRAAGDRELVVAATLPKTLAMALGWGIAQDKCRFFAGTHLLNFAYPERYQPMRVHPAQPASGPTAPRT